MTNSHYDGFSEYMEHLGGLSRKETDKLMKLFSYKRLKKNEHFLKAGEPMQYVGFHISGAFRYYYLDFEGNDITKFFVVDHDFILSLSAFIDRSPSLFSIEAIADSELLLAPVQSLYEIMDSSPFWMRMYTHILEKTYVIKEKREAEFLLYDAKTRYKRFIEEYPEVLMKARQHHIASYLGIAPESLSRIRSQMEKP